jgi:hypothetical protein
LVRAEVSSLKEVNQGVIDKDVLLRMGLLDLLHELGPQSTVAPRLASLASRSGPVFIVETDPIDELRPGLREAEGGEVVGCLGIDGQDLSEAATPDTAEELEGEAKVFLICASIDEDHDPRWADANVEESLSHVSYQAKEGIGFRIARTPASM